MARTASYILDSAWKKVDVLSFDSSCFNFTSINYGINIKSFFQVHPLDPLNQNNILYILNI